MQDLIDVGSGYDLNDPFVDNSEAVSLGVLSCPSTKSHKKSYGYNG